MSVRGEGLRGQHTPGPWRDLDLNWGHQILAKHPKFPGGLIVAIVNDDNPDERTAAANGRLIAAAPDLLWLAQKFHDLTETLIREGQIGSVYFGYVAQARNDAARIIREAGAEPHFEGRE